MVAIIFSSTVWLFIIYIIKVLGKETLIVEQYKSKRIIFDSDSVIYGLNSYGVCMEF